MDVVIIENNRHWLKRVTNIANKLLIAEKLDIEIISFINYNEEVIKLIYNGEPKIFVLDYELNDINADEIAHEIRDEANDQESKIIIFSNHDMIDTVIAKRLSILTYRLKKDDKFEEKLFEDIKYSINVLAGNRFISIKEGRQPYNLIIDSIVQVTKDKKTKYSIIKTKNNKEYRIRKSLLKLNEELNFERINNYTLVNPEQIDKLKFSNRN